MRLRPVRKQVLVRLDTEDRTVGKYHIFIAPDVDTIQWCSKCGRQMEAIKESVCAPEEQYETAKHGDGYVYKGIDTGHTMESVTMPIVVEKARRATVIASGSPEFDIGERILVDFASGKSADDDPVSPYRLVMPDSILARIDESDETEPTAVQ